MNDNFLEQILNSAEFIKQTIDLPFPSLIHASKLFLKKLKKLSTNSLKWRHENISINILSELVNM